MRKGKKIAVAKKTAAAFLTAAMVTGMLPAGQIQNVMAADDSPYVISTGRMVYASSSVGNSDPAYAVYLAFAIMFKSSFPPLQSELT